MARRSGQARALGRSGEQRAAEFYERQGFVVERNWRCRLGEIDLLCRRRNLLVICEVKARSALGTGSALEAVTPAKQRRLRRLAAAYLAGTAEPARTLRFDVVAIGPKGTFEVVEAAF